MKIFRSKAEHASDEPRFFTEQESRAATVEQAKDSKRGVRATIINIALTAVIGIASLAIAWLTYSLQTEQSSPTSLQSSPSDRLPTSPATEPRPASTTESSAQTGSSASGCYDGDTPTPCGLPHSREVFAKPAGASCDEGALILHMGGAPGVDLLASGIYIKTLENTNDLCVVEKQSGMPSVSLKDIWTVDNDHNGYKDGGELRRCFNHQEQQVSCDTDHASEEFFDAPADVDCSKKYEEFSGRPVDRSIRIAPSTRDNHIICRAEVQVSSDKLTASVRDLENASLPIKQS